MNHNPAEINKMLGLAFEIEGLLILAERREDMAPDEIFTMLLDKSRSLLDGITAIAAPDAPEAPAKPCEPEEITHDDEAIAESVEIEETEDADEEPAPVHIPEPEPAPVPAPAPTPEPKPEPTPAPAPAPVTDTPKVSPKVAVNEAAKIALTLNDKFRFRRTLFGGSDSQMTDTLAILAGITDDGDLNDFITNDLCWDPEDQEVIDFLAVVSASR